MSAAGMGAAVDYAQAGELKFGQVGIANLRVRNLDVAQLAAEMRDRVQRAPNLFARAAVVLDFGGLAKTPSFEEARALWAAAGVELEAALFPVRDVAVNLGFTWANTRYRDNLVGAGGSLSARVGYAYQSRVVATTEVVRDPLTGVTTTPISQDGYGQVNAGVIWKPTAAWTVSLQGSNLTDKAYRTTGYNLYAALGVHTGFYGPPRQYSLSVKYDF